MSARAPADRGWPSRIATLGPVGYLPAAPGTWGSAAALPPALALGLLAPPVTAVALLGLGVALLAALGVWATDRHPSDREDPSEVVIDE
ncbi:MAG: phosphatidylglycerophosphatase A, partial [Pseudomonadota bacterium]